MPLPSNGPLSTLQSRVGEWLTFCGEDQAIKTKTTQLQDIPCVVLNNNNRW